MKIKTLLLASLIAVQANANETEKAPKDLISEVIDYCKDMAADEQIGSALLYPNYLKLLDFSGRIKGFRQSKLEMAWLFSRRNNFTPHKFF